MFFLFRLNDGGRIPDLIHGERALPDHHIPPLSFTVTPTTPIKGKKERESSIFYFDFFYFFDLYYINFVF